MRAGGETCALDVPGGPISLGIGATLRLCTQPAMATAQRLYAAAGFTRTPDLDFEPVPGLTLRAYALPLAAPATAR